MEICGGRKSVGGTKEQWTAAPGIDLISFSSILSGRDQIYQELGSELTAVEPPLWCRLIAGYVRDRGYSVQIIDAEAEGKGPDLVAHEVLARNPRLVGMIVFGHQPSASTQQMVAASPTCRAIKKLNPGLLLQCPLRQCRDMPPDKDDALIGEY